MHIGLVIYGSIDAKTGGYLYDRRLVEYLRQQGDTVEIFSLPRGDYGRHLLDNLSFQLPGKNRPGRDAPAGKLDLLIQDELNHPSLLLANALPHAYPVVSLVHHLRCREQRPAWQNSLYRLAEQRYLRSVDGFIFNSHTTERDVQALLSRSRPSIVAYPPTDHFGMQVSGEQVIDRAQSRDFRLIFLGSLIPRKGLHTLLEAMRLLPQPSRLDVVGALDAEPAYSQEMQKLAARLDGGSQVRFHGALDRDGLAKLLMQAHVLVIPSTYEGFGIAYLEGMGFGLPAIGTTAGAASEVITDGTDGFLVPPDDPRALAERLRGLARDRQALTGMGLAARDRFKRQPPWSHTAGTIRAFLLKMIR